jgi:hypothetical protein
MNDLTIKHKQSPMRLYGRHEGTDIYYPIDIFYNPEINQWFAHDLSEGGHIWTHLDCTVRNLEKEYKAEYFKAWYQSNKAKKLAYQKEYYQKKNPELIKGNIKLK